MPDNLLYKDLSYKINGLLFSVHNELGRYINEKQICDAIEGKFKQENLSYEREKTLPPSFQGEREGRNRIDFIVEDTIIIEIKNKQILERQDFNQIMRYLNAENKKLGLLVNFGGKYLKIKRILNSNSNELDDSHINKLASSANPFRVKIKRLNKSLPLPEYHTSGSVAFDFYARKETTIPAGKVEKIPTGLIIQTPKNYGLIISARSSLMYKKGLLLSNGIGVIDQDYCGEDDEILISVYNTTNQDVKIAKQERIAQGMFMRIDTAEWQEVEKMNDPNRGGYGSTG